MESIRNMESIRKKEGSKEKGAQVKMGHDVVTPLLEKKYVILKSNSFMHTQL